MPLSFYFFYNASLTIPKFLLCILRNARQMVSIEGFSHYIKIDAANAVRKSFFLVSVELNLIIEVKIGIK